MKIEAILGIVFKVALEEFSEGGWSYKRQGTTTYCGTNVEVPTFNKSI
jgi:hypothetical protein